MNILRIVLRSVNTIVHFTPVKDDYWNNNWITSLAHF
jgi:hypothetical protein